MLRPPPRSPLFPYTTLFRSLVRRYNDQLGWQFDRIRDFLVLHYVATTRSDTPFWDHCRHMPIPDGLRDNIELFRDSGRFLRNGEEMFADVSWVQVMLGQGIAPQGWSPLVDQVPEADLRRFIAGVGDTIGRCVDAMPTHQQFIDRFCAAPPVAA